MSNCLLNWKTFFSATLIAFGLSASIAVSQVEHVAAPSPDPIRLVVMDPLSDKLACDCVQGYAQRKYESLGEFLSARLDRNVEVFWGESITSALESQPDKTAHLVIGKHSVVETAARELQQKLVPVAQLTGADGGVTQTGLIVVRRDDPAFQVADLQDYQIFFGPADCDEKYQAPMKLLREAGIEIPAKPEIAGACSEAATRLVELDAQVKAAAVISSYAEPLLEGCGTIEKGDLRVIGISDEVPFVTAFLNVELPKLTQTQIQAALLDFGSDPQRLKALESKSGFVLFDSPSQRSSVAADPSKMPAKKK